MPATPQRRRTVRRLTIGAAVLAAAGLTATALPAGADTGHAARAGRTVDVQLLSFNDFHGNLEPPQGSSGTVEETSRTAARRAWRRAVPSTSRTSLRTARKGHPYSVTAAAGDLVGASPLLSGLFHDEPTIEAMNKLGLDVTSVGNHEFDEGRAELTRLQKGGCHPKDGCYEKGKKFRGAGFPYLTANVTDEKTGKPMLKPYTVWKHKGVKIGFIGVTLEGTPDIVTADGVKGLKFHDEIETINKYAKVLEQAGREVDRRPHPRGRPARLHLVQLQLRQPRPRRRHLRADHRHRQGHHAEGRRAGHRPHPPGVRCTIPDPSGKPRIVTSAASFGKLYTDTTLTYDRRTRDIVRTTVKAPHAANHVVDRDQPKAADMTSLITRWNKLAAPIADRPVGYISADIAGRGADAPRVAARRPHRRRPAGGHGAGRQGRRAARADEPRRDPLRPGLQGVRRRGRRGGDVRRGDSPSSRSPT